MRGDCDGDLILAGRGEREETLLAAPARAAAPDAPRAADGLGLGCRCCCCCCTCLALPLLPSVRLPQVLAPETSALRLPPPTGRTVPGVIGRPRAAVAVLGALGLFRPAAVEGPVGRSAYEGGVADKGGVYAAAEEGKSSYGVEELGGDPINEEGKRKFGDGERIPRAVESRIAHPLLLPPLPLPRRLSCCFLCSSSWVSCASVLNRANPPPPYGIAPGATVGVLLPIGVCGGWLLMLPWLAGVEYAFPPNMLNPSGCCWVRWTGVIIVDDARDNAGLKDAIPPPVPQGPDVGV